MTTTVCDVASICIETLSMLILQYATDTIDVGCKIEVIVTCSLHHHDVLPSLDTC